MENPFISYQLKKGKDKTLLFLHGGGGSISGWQFTQPYFDKTDYTRVYMDLRGHGLSFRPKSWRDYCLEKHAQDVLAVINRLEIRKIVLIGHCLGAMVAATFASLYPKRLEKLILINPGLNKNCLFFNPLTYFLFLISYGFVKILNLKPEIKNKGRVDYTPFKGSHDLSPARLGQDLRHTGLVAAISCGLAFFNWPSRETYKNIKVPALIIGGKKDVIFGLPITYSIKRLINNAKLKIIDTNHISIINNPKEVVREILVFLQNL